MIKSLNTSKNFLHCVLMATIDLDYPCQDWGIVFKSHSISFSAVMAWNSLPINLRSPIRSMSFINFKRKLSNYLLSNI